jgi:hypothetical protein
MFRYFWKFAYWKKRCTACVRPITTAEMLTERGSCNQKPGHNGDCCAWSSDTYKCWWNRGGLVRYTLSLAFQIFLIIYTLIKKQMSMAFALVDPSRSRKHASVRTKFNATTRDKSVGIRTSEHQQHTSNCSPDLEFEKSSTCNDTTLKSVNWDVLFLRQT